MLARLPDGDVPPLRDVVGELVRPVPDRSRRRLYSPPVYPVTASARCYCCVRLRVQRTRAVRTKRFTLVRSHQTQQCTHRMFCSQDCRTTPPSKPQHISENHRPRNDREEKVEEGLDFQGRMQSVRPEDQMAGSRPAPGIAVSTRGPAGETSLELQPAPPRSGLNTPRAFSPPESNRVQFSPPRTTPRGTVRPFPGRADAKSSFTGRSLEAYGPGPLFQACKLSFQAGRSIQIERRGRECGLPSPAG